MSAERDEGRGRSPPREYERERERVHDDRRYDDRRDDRYDDRRDRGYDRRDRYEDDRRRDDDRGYDDRRHDDRDRFNDDRYYNDRDRYDDRRRDRYDDRYDRRDPYYEDRHYGRDRHDDRGAPPRGGSYKYEKVGKRPLDTDGSSSLFVGNLPYDITQGEFEDIFSKYGRLEHIKLGVHKQTGQPRGFGFVTYEDSRDAADAMEKLSGFDIRGRRLRLDWDAGVKKKVDAGILGSGAIEGGRPV